MTVALDLGTTSFRAVRVDRRRCRIRKLTAEYAVGDHNESTLAALRRLERGYLLTESKLVLVGETARLFAPMLNQTCRPIVAAIERPEPPHHDWVRRAALGQLLAPAATPDETCLLVAPRAWETSSTGAFEHLLTHLESFGYRPQRTSAGLAIVLAAGHRSGFTAVGLSFGAGSTEFSVVHRGRELARRSCVWGGNWVDARCRELWRDLHGTDLEIGHIRRWKRSDRVVLSRDEHDLELTLRQSVRDALDRALGEAASAFAPFQGLFSAPVDLLAAGGSTLEPGFEITLTDALLRQPLPFAVGRVRIVPRPELAVARGLMIHAGIEDLHVAPRAA